MFARLPLVILAGLVLFSAVGAAAEETRFDSMDNYPESLRAAWKLIDDYRKLESPTPQELARLKATPVVRENGPRLVSLQMAFIADSTMKDGRPSDGFDPDGNLEMFGLLRDLLPPLSGGKSRQDYNYYLGGGLAFMIRTAEAARDPVSAQKYYDLLRALPDLWGNRMMTDSEIAGVLSLVRLYCRTGDTASAVQVYDGIAELKDLYTRERKWEVAALLVRALAEGGHLAEVRKYYAELALVPPDSPALADKIGAGRALAVKSEETGDLEAAGQLAGEIEVMTEQLRILEEEARAAKEAKAARASRSESAD